MISELNSAVKGTPHSLVELSSKQWKRIKSNSIFLNDMVVNNTNNKIRSVTYKDITVGNEIKLRKKSGISNGIHYQWKSPMLGNVSNSVVAIVSSKKELMSSNSGIIITDSSRVVTSSNMNCKGSCTQSSGVVLLMIAKWDRNSIKSSYSWDAKDVAKLRTCKSNIITARTSHFSSTGLYFSFGNRGNFGLIHNSSVTQYVHKKHKNDLTTQKLSIHANTFDMLSALDMKQGVSSLASVIPTLKEHIAPTLNVIHNLQSDIVDLNMKRTSLSDHGMWQNSICVNCQTTDLHTENDCTYTVVTIPNQKDQTVPYFIFELKKGFTLGLQMDHGLSFLFSGQYLFHRQMLLDAKQPKDSNFFNFASYGSARLYNHLKSTYNRCKN